MSRRIPQNRLPRPKSMIVAPQPEAVDAGANVLRAGGNALDAALACALTQGVVDPLMCGLGSFGVLHIYDPATERHVVFEGLSACPLETREDQWADKYLGDTTDGFGYVVEGFVNEAGAMSVSAPPVLKLMSQAHFQFGKARWADLFTDAVARAEEGWLIRPHVYTVFIQDERKYGRMNYGEKLALTTDGRRIYLNADGSYKKPGSLVLNPDLARTLRTIAADGAESFYSGEIARRTIDDVRAQGGILSLEDLASVRVTEASPLKIDYRGWKVAMPRPPFGGAFVAQVLRMLENFDLVSLGHNSPEYIRVLCEAMKIALRDREEFVADPDFMDRPVEDLVAPEYTRRCSEGIRLGEKTDIVRRTVGESKHTTHISAVDESGMVVSFTHTLGNPSGFIVKGAGFMLNGGMSTYDPIPGRRNSMKPGKRRYSTMSPTLVFDAGEPVMTVGAPGASWIGPAVAQVLVNTLDWGMDIQAAISAPRVVSTSNAIDISNRIPRNTQRALEAMGYQVRRTHLSYAFAGVHGITQFAGDLRGGADPQRDGCAEGVYDLPTEGGAPTITPAATAG